MPSYTFTKRNQLRTRYKKPSAFTAVMYIAGILVIATLFIQLYVMSIFATKGEDVTRLEAQKTQLTTENKKLNQEIAQARQYDYIKEKSQNLGYVDINTKDVKYMTIEN